MHVAALPGGFGQDLLDRLLKPWMIIGDHELHPVQAARLEPEQELAPARATFPIGQRHTQHLAAPFPVHRHRNQHRLAADYPALTHPLIAGIQDQGNASLSRRSAKAFNSPSSFLTIALIAEAEKLCPHNSSVTLLTLRVDTPCTYISTRLATSAFS